MQIDPEAETFSEIVDLEAQTDEARAARDAFFAAEARPHAVLATSHDKETLKRLQDDLRKAGYRKAT